MDLPSFSDRHGAFYVPAFAVRVDGVDLTRTLAIGVNHIDVGLALNVPGRFSFSVVNAYDVGEHTFLSGLGRPVLDVLKFGASVEIAAGYGDHTSLPVLISGIVTEITTGFAEGASPELTVSGYDHLFPLTLGKRSDSWSKVADSDVVHKIARNHHLNADIESTEQRPQVEQNQESDFDLLVKLAKAHHFQFFVDPKKKLRFGRPRDTATAVASLAWGRGLFSFKPECNLATQVSGVEVYGWNADKKKAFIGKALAGEESGRDPRRKSGGDRVKAITSRDVILQVRQPVFSEAEAKRRAQAILSEHAKKFLTGEAESIGLPELLPDKNVDLGNLGRDFSKTYYIEQATHKVDTSGYRTRLKVKEPSI
jgi:uncharacterized protein